MLAKFLTALILIATCTFAAADTQNLPGGYAPVDLKDKDLQKVVAFAVAQMQQGNLIKIISAQKQVVAGLNYDLQLEIAAGDGTNHLYEVIVYVPLPNSGQQMQLTNIIDNGTYEEPETNNQKNTTTQPTTTQPSTVPAPNPNGTGSNSNG